MFSNDYYIFNKIYKNIFEKKKIKKKQIRISFIYLLKINFSILFFVFFYFKFIKIFSTIFFLKKFKNISIQNQLICLKISSFVLYPLKKKIYELIFSISLIQSRFPDEKETLKNEKNLNSTIDNIYEAIVVGSGPGGAISAYYLNEKYNSKILILEQGGHYENFKKKHPGREFLKMWKNGGVNTTLLSKMISFASGSCLGGGSEINSGLYHAPDEAFLKTWESDFKTKNLNELELKKKFDELTKICKIEKNQLKINIPETSHFIKGAKLNNFKIEELSTFHTYHDKFSLSKNSMSKTFIKKYIENGGKFCCNVKVNKISKEKNIWKISSYHRNEFKEFKAKNLFLCCGSIYTAHLLKKSKIKLNNKVSSFKFHPMIKLIAEFDHNVQNGEENVHPFQITEFYPDFIIGNASSGKEFISLNYPDTLIDEDNSWQKKLIYHVTYSFGQGNLISVLDEPIVNYNISKKNIKLIKKSILIASKVLFDGGAKKINILNNRSIEVTKNNYEKKIQKIRMKDLKFSAVHILGGLKSGENKNCHLNSFGKINNYENLYVNDSSIINHKLLKNPQGTIMSLAKRNIDHFIENAD